MKKLCQLLQLCFIILIYSCQPTKTYTLYVGSYTKKSASEGIYKFTFNTNTGDLTNKVLAAKITNPSFLKIAPNKKNLYAVREINNYQGKKNGAVSSFEIKKDILKEINTASVGGPNPCHVGISENGQFLAASNYSGGSVAIFTLNKNGSLNENSQYIDHKVLDTIKKSHAHASKFIKNELFTADLGLDAVKRYTLVNSKFAPAKQASIDLPDGAGPRHFTFAQNGNILYVINELNATITVFKKDADDTYIELEVKSTLAPDYNGRKWCADIHLSKDGKFLYGSNRGEDTIVIFKIDKTTGKLTLVGRESTKGNWPRNFALDPTNKFLLVANQKSDNITIFKRDSEKGTLTFLKEVKTPKPVCLEFLDL